MVQRTRAVEIREQLGYPVLDGDGHVVEMSAVFADYARDHGAGKAVDAVPSLNKDRKDWIRPNLSAEERRRAGLLPISWHVPADTEYIASVGLASRYYERIGEAGIDFAVLYPTLGLMIGRLQDDEPRVVLSRLYNEWMAEQYAPYQDRFTIAAVIPAHNPDEAIAEMVHAKELGAKVALIPSHIRRPLPGMEDQKDPLAALAPAPWAAGAWIDAFGLDSKYDYDPMWAKAVELRLPLASHSSGMGLNDRASISNYLYNQIGHFAASGAALAKSLFLGGVTNRFPELRVAMLEGGVAVGVEIFVSLIATWQKRGSYALKRLDPDNLDRELFAKLLAESAPDLAARYSPDELLTRGPQQAHDDFELTGVTSEEDIRDQFCRSFYWGCEADDPFVGLSVDPKILPLGAKVPAIMGSDIGHWDVVSFADPLEEAYELVEHGILDEAALRDFLFTNPVRFLTDVNPDFFQGTVVEEEAAAVAAARA